MKKEIKQGTTLHRSFQFEKSAIDVEARTVELSFASEAPYKRFWGIEILDLSPQSVRLGRLTSGGPLLVDHDSRDHVGVIESVRIDADRVGRALVRFGRSARADEVFRDVQDGIRRNVSVGYVIHKAVLVESNDDEETYRVTDWEPYEISIVSVPADASVGVGRSMEESSPVIEILEKTMSDIQTVDTAAIEQRARETFKSEEQKRISEIIAIGEQFARFGADKLAAEALRSGQSVDQFRQAVLEKIKTSPVQTAEIGMSEKEVKNFSFLRALNALANPGDRKAQEAAAFERECSDAVSKKIGRSANGIFVPIDVQMRDLTVGTPSAGGYTVATNLLAASFIDMLRNKLVITSLGAQFLSGLVGNIAIPRQTGGATAYWVAESSAPTESQVAFDQVAMSPKTVGAFTDMSRKLLLQSSLDVEGLVRRDLAGAIADKIDQAAINGSGVSNEPLGILGTPGIGSVAGGTNGAAPTWAHIVGLETLVAVANADVGNMGYLTNQKVRGKLKTTQKVATYGDLMIWENGNTINGYRTAITNQVPSNLTKGTSVGVCSAILFGNWSDLIIGQWGTLDLTVDPYSGATAGNVRVIAHQDVDVAVRHHESFSAMTDALTA